MASEKRKNPIDKRQLPSDDQQEIVTENVPAEADARYSAMLYQGPLPHPDIMQGYEDVVHGAADRILTTYEKEQQHRHETENRIVEAEARDSFLGIISATGIVLAMIFGGIYTVIHVPTIAGAITGIGLDAAGVAMVANVFLKETSGIWKRKSNDKDED